MTPAYTALLLALAVRAPGLAPAAPATVLPLPPAAADRAADGAGPPPPLLGVAGPAQPAVTEAFLPSGLRVVVVEHHRRPLTLVQLVFPRGSLTDPPASGGATHLAVQLASDFYEKSEADEQLFGEKSFRRQVAELGGAAAFEVDPDSSVVGISGYAQDTVRYLKLLAGAVTRPRHGEDSFAERRNDLLDAVEDLESSDPEALSGVLAAAAFGAGNPYARSPTGTLASLRRLGLEDIVARQAQVFVPRGATLLVVGDVQGEQVLSAARAAFERWRDPSPAPAPRSLPGGLTAGAEVGFLRRVPASTLVVCATRPLPDVRDSDAALQVLTALLGRGTGSNLMSTLRDGNGLAYDASATLIRRRGGRALLACSALAADRAELGIRLFREALEALRRQPPDEAALERARAMRLAELEAAQDDAAGSAGLWLEAIVLGDGHLHLDRERAAVERVTAAEIGRLAQRILAPGALRWIVSGDPAVAARSVATTRLGRLRPLSLQR